MKYTITECTNFCRIFEAPEKFPTGCCFGGGIPTLFQMVDWFNPAPALEVPGEIYFEAWRE